MPMSKRVIELEAFTKIFTEVYSAAAATKLIGQIRQRGNLRTVLRCNPGQQAHHVIPIQALKESRLVQKAVLGGFDINGAGNGIRMSIKRHYGRHETKLKYNNHVLGELFILGDKYRDCTNEEAVEQVHKLIELLNKSL
jgi:hypothetical protein